MLLSIIFVAAAGLSHASPSAADAQFDWDEIEPSWDLEYTPCYGELQCARLLLPLDWLNPEDTSQTVAIAIAKLPAQVDAGDETFGGTVITNPGGPGDSGVIHMIRNGHYLQSMFDGERRHHEILSFDPRGMFHSTPIADCYQRDRVDSSLSQWQSQGLGLLGDASTEQFRRRRAHATAFGQRCALADKDQSSIREHMSTASVARDMLAMVDKIEELKRKEMRDGSGASRLELRSDQANNAATEPRIQYYGTSYGTVLGNTFLSMFPGRVHRMVLDGLVVGEDYANLEWSTNLADNTKVVEYFYQACFAAKSRCALWRFFDESWGSIKARVDQLIAQLDQDPQPVAIMGGPEGVITGVEVRRAFLDTLYDPLNYHEALAKTLDDALQSNYTLLLEQLGMSCKVDVCSATAAQEEYTWQHHGGVAVNCGDGKDARGFDIPYWQSYVQRLKELSPHMGDLWAEVTFACSGWQIRPKYHFGGPFTSPAADPGLQSGRPSAPPLLLSSLYDPVTPLRSAYRVARGHPGSRVLVQRSVGHCAFLSSPSECTRRHIREYMAEGKLPADRAECEPDCVPFEDCPYEKAVIPR